MFSSDKTSSEKQVVNENKGILFVSFFGLCIFLSIDSDCRAGVHWIKNTTFALYSQAPQTLFSLLISHIRQKINNICTGETRVSESKDSCSSWLQIVRWFWGPFSFRSTCDGRCWDQPHRTPVC